MMYNLVGNDIKYTPRTGQVTVSAETREQTVQVKIKDTGIPLVDLPFIFDKFYPMQMDATGDIEGNGLGVAIVKSIVEKHVLEIG